MDIRRDALVAPKEIEDLREAVGWDRSEGTYEQILSTHYTYFTARDQDGLLVVCMSVISDGISDAFLLDLAVHPQYQHMGIGTRKIHGVITDIKATGIQCVHFTFEDRLESFYRQCGLHIIKAGIVDFKHMKWDDRPEQATSG